MDRPKRPRVSSFHRVATEELEISPRITMFGNKQFKGTFSASLWIWLYLGCTFITVTLLIVAFLTPNWGVLTIKLESDPTKLDWWQFGLWQTCRYSDSLCLGTRWPTFYSATRAFAVLTLLGNLVCFTWMLGHTFEKLLDYDPCAMYSLSILAGTSAICALTAVLLFGIGWPREFSSDYGAEDARLSYSFGLMVAVIPLDLISTVAAILDHKTNLIRLEDKVSLFDGKVLFKGEEVELPTFQKKFTNIEA